MDKITIRLYQDSDYETVSQMFEDFIDHLAKLDQLGRIVKQSKYGNNSLNKTLKEVEDKNGIFLVAEKDNQIFGLGVAVIEILSSADLMEVLPHKPGRITELYVVSQYRGRE